MSRKVLINQLQLSYSSLSNYDFSMLKTDPVLQKVLSNSSIYIITQRPVLSFENITFNPDEPVLHFEIHQQGNNNILKVTFRFIQDKFIRDESKAVIVEAGSHTNTVKFTDQPFNNVHGIKFFQEEKFIAWFSPEKFLQNYWQRRIEANIEGDIRDFTKYNVHYVGKATEQDIMQRLTGHPTLQQILSIEFPLHYGTLPTHEIAILLFEFKDNLAINTYDQDSDIQDMIDSLTGNNLPDQKTIFLDSEKALINAMQPKYNKESYKSYPKSKDGLHKHNLNSFSYTFTDPISLIYEHGIIDGGTNFMGGDTLFISANQKMEIIKASR